MRLASSPFMSRWLGAVLLTIGGLLLLFPRASEAPAAAGDKSAAASGPNGERMGPAPSVRVEHELIAVTPLPTPSPRPRAVVNAVDARQRRTAGPSDFVSRARRALIGDGRYRPQPFPRPSTR